MKGYVCQRWHNDGSDASLRAETRGRVGSVGEYQYSGLETGQGWTLEPRNIEGETREGTYT